MSNPICPYCGAESNLVDSARVYTRSYGPMFLCANYPKCDAYVGCHPGTTRPLGRLANAELRRWKKKAHMDFDPLWKMRHMRRGEAYAWLAKQMGLTKDETHIGMFSVEQCRQVTQIVKEFWKQRRSA